MILLYIKNRKNNECLRDEKREKERVQNERRGGEQTPGLWLAPRIDS